MRYIARDSKKENDKMIMRSLMTTRTGQSVVEILYIIRNRIVISKSIHGDLCSEESVGKMPNQWIH
jgi:hypothetical protein